MSTNTANPWGDWVTPDLARNPGLAHDVMTSPNPGLSSSIVSYAAKNGNVVDAINDHVETNGTQTFWSRLGNTTLTGLSWLGKPIEEIQKDYKFLHSAYVDHGVLPAFAMGLGIVGGGVGGFFLGGPMGAVLGADAAAMGFRKVGGTVFKDSYKKSEDENYIVSPGRDFSNALATATDTVGLDAAANAFRNTNSGFGKFTSGSADLAFDITADPIMVIGRFGQAMRGGKLVALDKAGAIQLRYPLMKALPGVKQFIVSRSKLALTSDQMDAVRLGGALNASSRQYNRALDDIASIVKTSDKPGQAAGEIFARYKELGTVAAGRISVEKLDTADKVHEFLKTSLYFGELEGTLAGQAMLPSRTLLRAKIGARVGDALKENAITSKAYKTFSGYMPYSVDAETQKLSLTRFRWDAPDSASVIYRIARFGMGDAGAKEMAGKYAEAIATNNLALARSIKNHTLFESLKAMGLPDDNAFVKAAYDAINKVGEPLVGTQIYGVDPLGRSLGEYVAGETRKIGGLTKQHASDMFDIPDFLQIKRALREYSLVKKALNNIDDKFNQRITRLLYGKNDEFIIDRYTNKIFKPLALATTGFGLRVAAAELIPTFARYGIINTFKAKLAVSAAKANYDLIPAETEHVMAATFMGLGAEKGIVGDVFKDGFPTFKEAKAAGLNFAARLLPEQQMEVAIRLVLANNGHLLSEAVSTGHGYDASAAYQMNQAAHYYFQIQRNSPMFRDLPEWTTYASSDIHYVPRYVTNINSAARQTTNQNIASDITDLSRTYLKGQKFQIEDDATKIVQHQQYLEFRKQLIEREYKRMLDATRGTYKGYADEITTVTRWTDAIANGDLRSFAEDRVDATLGMVIGKDGTYIDLVAKNIAAGVSTDLNVIKQLVTKSQPSVPAAVAGPMLQPYVPNNGFLQNITNLGFKKIIDPIVNGLAREPLYVMHVADAYARMAPRIASKMLTEDQALRIAQTQASYSMLPQIHNTALRNQFAQLARNFLPFYFAQEQALRRAFNALKDTSVASPLFSTGMRYYQIAEHGLSDPTFVQTDDNGNRFINFPVVGAFGTAMQGMLSSLGVPMVAGLPISAKGSLVSLKSVLPELQTPGVSPILAISANFLNDLFPSTEPIVKGAIGDISFQRGFWDTLIPATWLKTTLAALTPLDASNQMSNAVASALAAAYYHDQVPGPDSTEMERQQFIDRIKNNARSVLMLKAFLNITSPLAPQVSQEDSGFRDEFWKLVKEKGNYADAMLTFLGNHGDKAISYTVAKTESNIPGAKYPYTQETLDYMNNNPELFNPKNRQQSVVNGAFFLIPQDGIKQESDIAVFNEMVNMHLRSRRTPEELLKQFYVAQGDQVLSGLRTKHLETLATAKANYDSFTQRQEETNWSNLMKKMQNLYPIWYKDYTNNDGKTNAQISYNQLIKIFSSENPPQHDQAKLVSAVIGDYQRHQQVMNEYKMTQITGFAPQQETQQWQNYLMSLSVSEPRLKTVINSVFMKLG